MQSAPANATSVFAGAPFKRKKQRPMAEQEQQLPESAARVQQALSELGIAAVVRDMPATTRTAKEASESVGCQVGQIAKSLIFRGAKSGRALLIIASGSNRVNEKAMAAIVGEPIERATPEFVREATGFAIGGVPPLGHKTPIATWFDQALLGYERIWAAAGTPFSVFEISPQELLRATGATVVKCG
jgi:prolyl-tRNA editing enzyme YbaK/EbsC (Cys-tRNA(Pro) deacylase)